MKNELNNCVGDMYKLLYFSLCNATKTANDVDFC